MKINNAWNHHLDSLSESSSSSSPEVRCGQNPCRKWAVLAAPWIWRNAFPRGPLVVWRVTSTQNQHIWNLLHDFDNLFTTGHQASVVLYYCDVCNIWPHRLPQRFNHAFIFKDICHPKIDVRHKDRNKYGPKKSDKRTMEERFSQPPRKLLINHDSQSKGHNSLLHSGMGSSYLHVSHELLCSIVKPWNQHLLQLFKMHLCIWRICQWLDVRGS